jgi:hypothetical protein
MRFICISGKATVGREAEMHAIETKGILHCPFQRPTAVVAAQVVETDPIFS